MKKVLAIVLASAMVFVVCGCSSKPDDTLSQQVEYEHEQIIVDQNGNPVTSNPSTSSEGDTTNSSTDNSSNTSSNASSNDEIFIDYNTVVEVDICDDVVRGYLDASTPERQFSWLNDYSGKKYDNQFLEFEWKFDGSTVYTFTFSEKADFSNPYIAQTSSFMKVSDLLLVPGKTYYWKVTGTWNNEVLGGGKIYVKDAPVRWTNIDGVGNVRDMGGWKAEGGKKVKYGMLYRGKALGSLVNNEPKIYVTEKGIATIKQLGIKTELDLRYLHQKFQTPGTGLKYEFIEHNGQYDNVLKSNAEVIKASYKRIFELLSNKDNYPFYAHCNAGADRTGTFAFIANGVLGVSYEDLTRDFELTSFGENSTTAKRWRADNAVDKDGQMNYLDMFDKNKTDGNYVAWGKLYNEMMEYGRKGGYTDLQSSIEYWLTSYIGVPKSQIDSFKSIMLQ